MVDFDFWLWSTMIIFPVTLEINVVLALQWSTVVLDLVIADCGLSVVMIN